MTSGIKCLNWTLVIGFSVLRVPQPNHVCQFSIFPYPPQVTMARASMLSSSLLPVTYPEAAFPTIPISWNTYSGGMEGLKGARVEDREGKVRKKPLLDQ